MLRISLRTFRTLSKQLPNEFTSNRVAQLKLVNHLKEVEETSTAGGSEKAKKLHKSRNKFFGSFRVHFKVRIKRKIS